MLTPEPSSAPPELVNVLLISSLSPDEISLRHIFSHTNWVLHTVRTCCEALAYTIENDTAVLICERYLPDGDWTSMLDGLDRLPLPPSMIVTSRIADDEFWAEVLNLGGYDVLAQPFDPDEVYRVVFLAWHERRRRARAWGEFSTVRAKTQAHGGALAASASGTCRRQVP